MKQAGYVAQTVSDADGSYNFLGGKEAIKSMTIGKGLKVNLFASEEKFPELINPVQMAGV